MKLQLYLLSYRVLGSVACTLPLLLVKVRSHSTNKTKQQPSVFYAGIVRVQVLAWEKKHEQLRGAIFATHTFMSI